VTRSRHSWPIGLLSQKPRPPSNCKAASLTSPSVSLASSFHRCQHLPVQAARHPWRRPAGPQLPRADAAPWAWASTRRAWPNAASERPPMCRQWA
jgi:hypothetical protein